MLYPIKEDNQNVTPRFKGGLDMVLILGAVYLSYKSRTLLCGKTQGELTVLATHLVSCL